MPDRLRRRSTRDRAAFDVDRLQYEVGDELDRDAGTTGTETPGETRKFKPSPVTRDRTPGVPGKDGDAGKS